MSEFFQALLEDDNVLLRVALLTGVLASIACGIVGTYVVTRRISYIAGAVSHSVLGGLGAARYCEVVLGWSWAHPLLGAVVSALLAALVIGVVSLRAKEREDTAIGAVWAIGMAAGILFISRTPGYAAALEGYLFGSYLIVSPGDLWLLAGLDAVVVTATVLCYKEFLAVCFDAEFARLRGVPVGAYYLFLLCLTALAVVLLVSVVGIVMVIALLTLPAAIAGGFARSLWRTMLLATLLSILLTSGGLAVSYAPGLPTGATTIVLTGLVYVLVLVVRFLFRPGTQ